jgi:Mn-dependent DtxR family transcriptional regulator
MGLQITESIEQILDEFEDKGNLTTGALTEFTELSKPTVSKHVGQTHAAGSVEYLLEPTVLWELNQDTSDQSE